MLTKVSVHVLLSMLDSLDVVPHSSLSPEFIFYHFNNISINMKKLALSKCLTYIELLIHNSKKLYPSTCHFRARRVYYRK